MNRLYNTLHLLQSFVDLYQARRGKGRQNLCGDGEARPAGADSPEPEAASNGLSRWPPEEFGVRFLLDAQLPRALGSALRAVACEAGQDY